MELTEAEAREPGITGEGDLANQAAIGLEGPEAFPAACIP